MAVQWATTLRNDLLDTWETSIGTSAVVKLFTGSKPADCATADSGTLLVEFDLGSDWAAAASSGSKALSSTPIGATAVGGAPNDAGYYRVYASDGTTCKEQGDIASAVSAWVGSTAVTVGQKRNNNGRIYTCTTSGTTASSGGPLGTGSSISDGTAVWSYTQDADMTIDNISITTGQTVKITSWTKTAPGA